MKTYWQFRTAVTLLFFFLASVIKAQQSSFEGVITYEVEVKSKLKGISDQSISRLLGLSPILRVSIKNGHYYRNGGLSEEFHTPEQQKAFVKFKQRDTLDYVNYDADSSVILELKKSEKKQSIAGYQCKSLIIKTSKGVTTYFYSPSLYQDPAFAAGNTIGHYDVFAKETQSIYLKSVDEDDIAVLTLTAVNITPCAIKDDVFTLPALPIKELNLETMITPASYKSAQDWMNYMKKNGNVELAGKYLKIPPGDSMIKQTAIVNFVVLETGQVGIIQIANPNDIHPALAKEAMRLIRESFGWKPATINGLKIDSWLVQPITFINSN